MVWLTGPAAEGWEKSIDWAVENVNEAGGIDGHPLEVEYVDVGTLTRATADAACERLANDPKIAGILTALLKQCAPFALKAKKVAISASSTSGDIYRAFAGKDYIWRSVESDIAQMQVLLGIASRDGAKSVALVTDTGDYGSTFFDWFGFFATELGLTITDVIRYDKTEACAAPVQKALAKKPDVLFYVPGSAPTAGCAARAVKDSGVKTRLLMPDGAQFTNLVEDGQDAAEGVEGTAPVSDPDSGFDQAYNARFGMAPPLLAAQSYDAAMLLAFGLQRSKGVTGAALAKGLKDVVSARGEKASWTLEGVQKVLSGIRSGNLVDIQGASGPLDYDSNAFTDVTSSVYGRWKVVNGAFQVQEYFRTTRADGSTESNVSVFRTEASNRVQQALQDSSSYVPPERRGLWAVVMATSGGWDNYRHQADALAQYQLLKARGVGDSRIVLILRDDLAYNPSNPEPGVVRNVAGGPNLYVGAQVDYAGSSIGPQQLLAILSGKKSADLPVVVESTENDNVFVFLVGHGGYQGVFLGSDKATYESGNFLAPRDLANTVKGMATNKAYRRMLVVIEACHGGTMGSELPLAPGALLISGANAYESSLGANYDASLRSWLGDEFAFKFWSLAQGTPDTKLADAYVSLYKGVAGSHVTLYNMEGFSGVRSVALSEFFTP
jgi:ABC-type branched-subunit amino acid transport system substrate-binding protein/glycosylphosphatidylinositol transamidase (GPIT) subunit GPI8